MSERLRVATRGSALALAQSEAVMRALRAAWPGLDLEVQVVMTDGDRHRDVPTADLGGQGGKGAFTAAVQRAVLDGRADLAVHSAKDLPAVQVPGLVIAAVPERDDPRDVLLGPDGPIPSLDGLAEGARVGTGSPRRAALIGHLRPDLKVVGVRGNVDSRVRRARAGDLEAFVLAAAGLRRLGLHDEASVPLDPAVFTPAPGQGSLAVEAAEEATGVLGLLSDISHPPSRLALRAERAFLARLGGSCTLPAGAHLPPPDGEQVLHMSGFLAAADGSMMVSERVTGPRDDPEGLGAGLASLLIDRAPSEVRVLVGR
jgi:hydroxymethylbilane synthase